MEIKKVNIPNGEQIAYREGGKGKLILLIHGNMVSSRHWGQLLDELSKEYRVIALDIRGCGLSSYNKPIDTFKDFAYDVKLFCDELNLKNFLLIGWSMGGGISQRFVADFEGYANSLILYESVPCSGYPYHKKGPNGEFLPECYQNKEELLQDRIQLKPMIDALETNNRQFIKYLWDQLVLNNQKPDDKEYEELLDDIFMTRNLKDAAWAAHSFNISHVYNGVVNGSGEIDRINIPVALFAGDRDLVVPQNFAEFTCSQIGENAKVEILEGCGHAPHYDNINLVLEKIRNFYK